MGRYSAKSSPVPERVAPERPARRVLLRGPVFRAGDPKVFQLSATVVPCRRTLTSWRGSARSAAVNFSRTPAVCAGRAAVERAETVGETDRRSCLPVRRNDSAKRALPPAWSAVHQRNPQYYDASSRRGKVGGLVGEANLRLNLAGVPSSGPGRAQKPRLFRNEFDRLRGVFAVKEGSRFPDSYRRGPFTSEPGINRLAVLFALSAAWWGSTLGTRHVTGS